MGKTLATLALVILLGCSAAPGDRRPYSDSRLDAILWQRTSAEYAVLSRSIYNAALSHLDHALADRHSTALPSQKSDYSELPPAIIMDIDETVIDTSVFQGELVRDRAPFATAPWRKWQERNQPAAVPGAVEFIATAQARGVTIFFITNRDHPTEAATRRNLEAIGITLPPSVDTILCRNERADWDSDKESRRQFVAGSYRVLMVFGDDLGDFTSEYRAAPAERRAEALKHAHWGTKWFMLPNPMYGSWEASLYDFRSDLTPDDIGDRKFQQLR